MSWQQLMAALKLRPKEARHRLSSWFLYRHLGNQLKAIRRQRGWSRKELARRAGLHVSTIRRVERGRQMTGGGTMTTIVKIAHAMDCVAHVALLGWSDWAVEVIHTRWGLRPDIPPPFDQDPGVKL